MAPNERQLHRLPTRADIIDRVLDKGIVIEYHGRISIGGIDTMVTVDARYVTASIDTYRQYSDQLQDAGILTGGDLLQQLRRRW